MLRKILNEKDKVAWSVQSRLPEEFNVFFKVFAIIKDISTRI